MLSISSRRCDATIFDALGYLDNWDEILSSNGSYMCIGAAGNEIDADAIGIL